MQLSLKQSELVVAVRQYVAKQGLNLAGKDVTVLFSATRGEDGIKATIDIDEVDMPDLTPNVQPQLRVVTQTLPAIATNPVPPESPFAFAGNAADEQGEVLAVAGDAANEEPAVKKATSLFN